MGHIRVLEIRRVPLLRQSVSSETRRDHPKSIGETQAPFFSVPIPKWGMLAATAARTGPSTISSRELATIPKAVVMSLRRSA
jgi:hypothetical protein